MISNCKFIHLLTKTLDNFLLKMCSIFSPHTLLGITDISYPAVSIHGLAHMS